MPHIIIKQAKIGKFKPEHLGQLIFYVNAINELEKTDVDEPTIGLLLCKDADKFVAETTLKNSLTKLGISKYKYIEELPEYLERKLLFRYGGAYISYTESPILYIR